MFKSSLLVSVILAAGAPACHHDHHTATPATAEATSGGMTATAEPGNTSSQSNSYNTSNSDSSATSPGATVPGNPQLPRINDPDRTGSPRTPSGSSAPIDNGTDTGRDMGNPPDTTTPTTAKDTNTDTDTDTGSGSNANRRDRGKTSGSNARPRSGSNNGSNGNGSADGSAGSGSDVPKN